MRFFLVTMATAVALVACGAPTDPMVRGKERFTQCTPCHGADGAGNPALQAPPIAGLPSWYVEAQLGKFRNAMRGAHFDDAPGLRMRPMALTLPTEDDVKAVSLYAASLAPPMHKADPLVHGADVAHGATLFATCTACHGQDGSGNQQLGAPPIAGHPDWYIEAQVKKFRSGIRGAKPGDVQGPTMRAIALSLTDDQAIKDVASYVSTLPYK